MARTTFASGSAPNALETIAAGTTGTFDGVVYNEGEGAMRFTLNFDSNVGVVTIPGSAHRSAETVTSGSSFTLDGNSGLYFQAVKTVNAGGSIGAENVTKSHSTSATNGDFCVVTLTARA